MSDQCLCHSLAEGEDHRPDQGLKLLWDDFEFLIIYKVESMLLFECEFDGFR